MDGDTRSCRLGAVWKAALERMSLRRAARTDSNRRVAQRAHECDETTLPIDISRATGCRFPGMKIGA
jgi:hypothetical protein